MSVLVVFLSYSDDSKRNNIGCELEEASLMLVPSLISPNTPTIEEAICISTQREFSWLNEFHPTQWNIWRDSIPVFDIKWKLLKNLLSFCIRKETYSFMKNKTQCFLNVIQCSSNYLHKLLPAAIDTPGDEEGLEDSDTWQLVSSFHWQKSYLTLVF